MSVDINWETLTGGPDGLALAETIRSFVHHRFQQVTLPRFIRTVKVRAFEFGGIAPEIELKDICDPLPDFYDEGSEDGDSDSEHSEPLDAHASESTNRRHSQAPESVVSARTTRQDATAGAMSTQLSHANPNAPRSQLGHLRTDSQRSGLSRSSTLLQQQYTPGPALTPFHFGGLQSPGIPGGTSNLNYFHLPLSGGLSGTATPLAAVAGARFAGVNHGGFEALDATLRRGTPPLDLDQQRSRRRSSVSSSSLTPPSTADPGSRPPSQHYHEPLLVHTDTDYNEHFHASRSPTPPSLKRPEPDPQDLQIVAHARYNGNLKLALTAEILLDYPMQSFVGIPLQLNITGVDFDGVAILAYIKKKAHFCFLSPEDADALVGRGSDLVPDDELGHANRTGPNSPSRTKLGGLLEQIKVESEIGDKDNGKQVLKNVGKVEKFVLEQVRRIFEDELVYPSFWTVLV